MGNRADFYDELEMLAASRRPCEIVFMKDGGRAVIHGSIADISSLGDEGYILMDSGLEIMLDTLVEVNGRKQSNLS